MNHQTEIDQLMADHPHNAEAVKARAGSDYLNLEPRSEAEVRRGIPLAYCDYIAHRIKDGFKTGCPEGIISHAGKIQWDLHPVGGYMLSTKKTILVTDRNGKEYRVTVEEVVAPVAELPVERLIFEAKSKVHELNQRDLYSQDTFDEELMAECLRLCRGDKLKAQLLASVVREL